MTTIIVKHDVGHGNTLYLRGEGAGLNWETGVLMENVGSDEWMWSTDQTGEEAISCKVLINDEIWSEGENWSIATGETSTLYPAF